MWLCLKQCLSLRGHGLWRFLRDNREGEKLIEGYVWMSGLGRGIDRHAVRGFYSFSRRIQMSLS